MNTGFEAKGTLVKKLDTVTRGNDFTVRKVWVRIDEETEYPQTIEIELIKDKCQLVDKFNNGDSIAIDVNVRGRRVGKDGEEWVFNSLNGWRVRGNATGRADADQNTLQPDPPSGEEPDDLPF